MYYVPVDVDRYHDNEKTIMVLVMKMSFMPSACVIFAQESAGSAYNSPPAFVVFPSGG